jgi:hypothetical protein
VNAGQMSEASGFHCDELSMMVLVENDFN